MTDKCYQITHYSDHTLDMIRNMNQCTILNAFVTTFGNLSTSLQFTNLHFPKWVVLYHFLFGNPRHLHGFSKMPNNPDRIVQRQSGQKII